MMNKLQENENNNVQETNNELVCNLTHYSINPHPSLLTLLIV